MTSPPRRESPGSRAWLYVIVNTLGFPGLGTIMARRPFGYAQAAITVVGFVLFMGFMLWYFAGLLRAAGDFTADLEQFQRMTRSRIWIGGLGLALVFLAWVWAVFSSMAILRMARETQMPPPAP